MENVLFTKNANTTSFPFLFLTSIIMEIMITNFSVICLSDVNVQKCKPAKQPTSETKPILLINNLHQPCSLKKLPFNSNPYSNKLLAGKMFALSHSVQVKYHLTVISAYSILHMSSVIKKRQQQFQWTLKAVYVHYVPPHIYLSI